MRTILGQYIKCIFRNGKDMMIFTQPIQEPNRGQNVLTTDADTQWAVCQCFPA